MIEKIGETAGEVWRIIREKEEVNISQLPRLLNEKSAVVYQAVGWLARENKIEYKTVGAKTLVSLTESER
jgi:hypothetical protein